MKYLKKFYHIAVIVFSIIVCWFAWPTISNFTSKEIQPIASAVSTISGILFGFVMASISLFASAKENKLVRNTTLTGHLPKLVERLHTTMGWLLVVCLIFLVVLFLPDTFVLDMGTPKQSYKYSSILVLIGIFFLINSFSLFRLSWYGFENFTRNM